jgi:glycosyltransferase involved in cell wall biosynthesis
LSKPLLSVLLPVFNAEKYLESCLQSLTRQTFKQFEIIVVNDGSTDSTPRLLMQEAQRDGRIRMLDLSRVGLIPALNLGLRACRADLVARMDADDICRTDRFEKQMSAMQADPKLHLVSSQTVSFPRKNVEEGFRLYETWLNGLLTQEEIEKNMFVESPFAHPSVMFNKKAVLAVGGYRDCSWPEDYDLWLRLHAQGARFAKLPHTLLAWRMHECRYSFTHPRYSQEAFFKLKCEFLIPRLPKQLVVLGAGRIGRAWVKAVQDKGITVNAVLDIDPKKIGMAIKDVPIVSYEKIGDYPDEYLLAAVGKRGQRNTVREFLARSGRNEGKDYICVA